jgi:hypothetical protein
VNSHNFFASWTSILSALNFLIPEAGSVTFDSFWLYTSSQSSRWSRQVSCTVASPCGAAGDNLTLPSVLCGLCICAMVPVIHSRTPEALYPTRTPCQNLMESSVLQVFLISSHSSVLTRCLGTWGLNCSPSHRGHCLLSGL